jgi:GTP-binding protein
LKIINMDKVEITITAGRGGRGVVSFWREKFHPLGGPDGGDGGRGGDIYIKASSNEQDLSKFRNKRSYRAESGKNGEKQKKHGRDGEDLYINVPVGTTVYRKEESLVNLMADLRKDGEEALVARGGKGGLGNVHFVSSTKKAPREATDGKPGEVVKLILEYRIVADVCIIGLPNSGKSSLLTAMTATGARIAEYPFTTVEPVMGQVVIGYDNFTVIEIPALIEDSSLGKGLGNKFLKHCQRSRILLFIVDASKNPLEDLNLLRKEVGLYDKELLKKPVLIVINIMDGEDISSKREGIAGMLAGTGAQVFFVSARTGEGIEALIKTINDLLKQLPESVETEKTPEFVFRPRPVSRRKKE